MTRPRERGKVEDVGCVGVSPAVDAEAGQLVSPWRDPVDGLPAWERELVPADLEAVGAMDDAGTGGFE